MVVETLQQHETLISSLMSESRWPGGGEHRQRIDTHISTVVLAGDRAYKIKKPLDLGFLNFLSIDSRHQACLDELRLNRRLAPEIYEAVCAITGTPESPRLEGEGPIIDWAVRMQRFDPDAILSNPGIDVSTRLIDDLAQQVGRFHLEAMPANESGGYGLPQQVAQPMQQNFRQIGERMAERSPDIGPIEAWTRQWLDLLRDDLQKRRVAHHVRECHGDLHLGNIALIDGRPVVFDAIEFNEALRWIDTINDVAFLTMDLRHRGQDGLAYRFLDRYLQHTGDYEALALLQLYEVYRAMVRAKIAAIRFAQVDGDDERDAVFAELNSYVGLASRLSAERKGAVLITYGVSGSGKSFVTKDLPDRLPVVRLRSDVERKRLLGAPATSDISARDGYSAALTEKTYARLAELAEQVARAGYVALVDATFLDRRQRDRFAAIARDAGLPFGIIDCDAPEAVLRERILQRRHEADNVSDADLAVLTEQLRRRDPLDAGERAVRIEVRPGQSLDFGRLRRLIGY